MSLPHSHEAQDETKDASTDEENADQVRQSLLKRRLSSGVRSRRAYDFAIERLPAGEHDSKESRAGEEPGARESPVLGVDGRRRRLGKEG